MDFTVYDMSGICMIYDICLISVWYLFTLTSLGRAGSTSFSWYPMASYSLAFSFSLNSFSNCSSRIINNYMILSTIKYTMLTASQMVHKDFFSQIAAK